MTIFHYIPLLGGLFNFALSLFVLGCDRRSRLNQVFAAWGIGIAIWNLGTYAMFRVDHHPGAYGEAFKWAQFLQYGVIIIPPTLLHVTLMITGHRVGKWIIWLYGLHAGLLVMNASGWFISGVRDVEYAWYSIAGPGFWIYALSLTQTFASVLILWSKRQSLPSRQRGRFNGILMAQTLIVVLGTNDILPILGVDFYPFTDIGIRPYGSLAATAYGVMVAYSVFQHQLLDVHLALGRSAAYVLRFVFLMLIAVVLQLTVAAFAPKDSVTTYSFVSGVAVIVVASLIASFLFPKLLGGVAEELERKLLGDHFEYQDQIRSFTEQSRWRTELPGLLQDLHTLLVNTLRVRSYWIVLLDETNRAFTLARAHPTQPERQLDELSTESALFRYFLESKQGYLALNPGYERGGSGLESQARAQLRQFVGELAFPLIVEHQPVGVLILGEKNSRDPYTRTDTRLLISLTENLALVFNQISLKNRLLLNQELDLLGRMSRGMAHDLNNLITPVWTLLQLIGEGESPEALRTELVPVAIRNIHTMRSYIKEALFFSENLRPDFQLGRLDALVTTVVDLARENRRKGKNISYRVDTGGETLVEMDQVLIQRLLTNVISNAVDASPEDGEIKIEIIRLVKTDAARDWLRVRVTDYGSGIRSEHLDRIFQPYFTTKKTGDEERGFGLGLAICRKIASLHGGSLGVASELEKGTVVNLDLPNRQKPGKPTTLSQPVTPAPQPTST
jgi:signal transduction histidine kinase